MISCFKLPMHPKYLNRLLSVANLQKWLLILFLQWETLKLIDFFWSVVLFVNLFEFCAVPVTLRMN